MPSVLTKRGTFSQLLSAAAANQLRAHELYYLTDQNRLVIGTGVSTFVDLPQQGFTRTVYNGTWAGRPTSGLTSGNLAWITDLGVGGALMVWNGSAWRATSPILMYARHGSFAAPLSTLTGVTQDALPLPGGGAGVRLPAGLLAGDAICEVSALVRRTTAVATCKFTVWLNNTNSYAENLIAVITGISATANRQTRFLNEFALSASGVLTRDNWIGPGWTQTGAASDFTVPFNNTVDTFVGVGVNSANAGDTFELIRLTVTVK